MGSGWAFVDEYEGDDLAEDSDNEKRMEKAENRAERKLAKKRKTREVRMKDDSEPKLSVPPGTLQPFPAKGVEPVKAAGTSLKPPPGKATSIQSLFATTVSNLLHNKPPCIYHKVGLKCKI